jgi:hypothetical protein
MTKLVSKRVARLEARYRVGPPTEAQRLLLARIEAGLRRVAQVRGFEPPHHYEPATRGLTGMSIVDILNAGRARAAQQSAGSV